MAVSKEDIMQVKGRGFLLNRGTECFSGRIVPVGGVYSADDLQAIAECARRFGNGKVCFTSRLCAEIPGIPFEKIDAADAFIRSAGLRFGGTGSKVRPITACKGTTCIYGNIDTQQIAAEIDQRFYVELGNVKLPHKFKIGVGGCPNSCMKPSLNDVGVEGCKVFEFNTELCKGCKKCAVETACPSRSVQRIDEKAVIDADKCKKCGVCIGKCPFGAVPKQAESMCRVYAGGTWGKTSRMGTALNGLFRVDEIMPIIEKIMLWYKENGFAKERLGATIDRVGVSSLESALTTDDLLQRREEIVAAPLKERN